MMMALSIWTIWGLQANWTSAFAKSKKGRPGESDSHDLIDTQSQLTTPDSAAKVEKRLSSGIRPLLTTRERPCGKKDIA